MLDPRGVDIRESSDIAARPPVVWLVVSEIEKWPDWNPICLQAKKLSEEIWRPGGQFEVTIATTKDTYRLVLTVTEAEQGRRVGCRGKRLGFSTDFNIQIDPVDGNSRVTIGATMRGPLLLLPWLAPVPDEVEQLTTVLLDSLKRESERRARDLKEAI